MRLEDAAENKENGHGPISYVVVAGVIGWSGMAGYACATSKTHPINHPYAMLAPLALPLGLSIGAGIYDKDARGGLCLGIIVTGLEAICFGAGYGIGFVAERLT